MPSTLIFPSTFVTAAASFLLAGGSAFALTVPLLTNTNGGADITSGELYNFRIINSGTTAYFGIPYVGGAVSLPPGEAFAGVMLDTHVLSLGGPGRYLAGLYAGDPATGVPVALAGFGLGLNHTVPFATDDPAADNPGSGGWAYMGYSGAAADPFAAAAATGFLWLGITNNGSTSLALYTGGINGVDVPAPAYTAAAPLGLTAEGSLNPDSYYYTGSTPDPDGPSASNAVPYINLTVYTTTIPEPSAAAFGLIAGLGLLSRRRRGPWKQGRA